MLADNDSVRTTLISGEPELCKAFLFEVAISLAKEGQQVFYFAPKQLESLPPAYHDRSEPSADALKHMTFISTANYEDLVSQLVKLQTFQRPPSVLLVEQLETYANATGQLGCSRELHVARCCAVLLNAALSCWRVRQTTIEEPVHLCAAVSRNSEHEQVYQRYFDNCWSIEAGEETQQGATDSTDEAGRTVWMREEGGEGRALEFYRLDEAVLVLRRIFTNREVNEGS